MVIEGKGKPPKSAGAPNPNRPSPVSRIGKIASLKKFPDRAQALDLLHDLARMVAPIINDRKYNVGILSEMDPKNPNLLGLNVNHGQKILIRLRQPYNSKTFLPMSDLIGTFLHELCHNVHGPHNAAFYALLDSLKTQYETASYISQYFAEENKLGSGIRSGWVGVQRMREQRLKKLGGGTYKGESRRLGGLAVPIGDRRAAMLEAAERRRKDSQWCSEAAAGDVPSGDDLEIENFIDLTGDIKNVSREKGENGGNQMQVNGTRIDDNKENGRAQKKPKIIEVIDLTGD